MYCEQCHQRDAVVHILIVATPSGEKKHQDYCGECFRESHKEFILPGWIDHEAVGRSKNQAAGGAGIGRSVGITEDASVPLSSEPSWIQALGTG